VAEGDALSETELMFSGLVALPLFVMFGGFVMLGLTIWRGARQAEFRHRERMAMIERGMTPPDPVLGDARLQRAHGVKMTLGIMLCGLGLALTMLIAFAAGDLGIGLGIGGAFVMVGLAFIVAAMTTRPEPDRAAAAPRDAAAPALAPPLDRPPAP
jgi:hypothetical protein